MVAFVDVTVIPMDRERTLPHSTVVVQGDRILTVGPTRLEPEDILAGAAGVECVLEIESEGVGTVVVRGPGAGGPVTAGAVYEVRFEPERSPSTRGR